MPQTYSPRIQYRASPIEAIVSNYMSSSQANHIGQAGSGLSHIEKKRLVQYDAASPSFTYAQNLTNYFTPKQKQYHATDGFLNLYRPSTQFIDDAEQIEDFVKEAFEKTTNKQFPDNIVIRVLDKQDMKTVHEANNGIWSDSIQGFALNTKPTKQVFVKKGDLDRLMLVVGHEIGHVLTSRLESTKDEEAKAFAFEMAWMKTIVKHNIANLKDNLNINFQPANNGLHNVAFNFVKDMIAQGKEALDVYQELAGRVVSFAG
ncbi:hypothetical protein COV16_01655 [Candidatus Woesearchaeota archaeon CG10_big_fil_rev_8_21_14_0_10_34_8]|nr:MAG: hypothetical protein COV16_01655 [Candidatus Woesearchaeota archaeon CG10_big_fil_rev_8_21_14_0_10_34_8]